MRAALWSYTEMYARNNTIWVGTSYTIVYRKFIFSANKSPTFMREQWCYFIYKGPMQILEYTSSI